MSLALSKPPSFYLIPVLGVICLFPFVNAAMALLMGMGAALLFGNPHQAASSALSKKLLAFCVVGLGAGMNLNEVLEAGFKGMGYTAASIVLVLAAGFLMGRLLKSDGQTSFLITVGTAICGGSAIAAVAPVIHGRSASISVALGVVFALNALALMLFPVIGHMADLSQSQFGLWSALAIHDTSSVVGAGMIYGAEALQIGTTVKLARALWIIPLVLVVSFIYHRYYSPDDHGVPPKRRYPWFIFGFLAVAALVTWVPALAPIGSMTEFLARRGLVLCLFLIGAGLSRETLRSIGVRPLIQGAGLWVLVAAISLAVIKAGWIAI